MRLEGKVAVVTGAASGFGAGIARRFVEEGARVLAVDLDASKGKQLVSDLAGLSGEAAFFKGNVAHREDTRAFLGEAVSRFGHLDILVNNAGITHKNKSMLEVSDEEFTRIFDVNVRAIVLALQEAVPIWRRQGTGGVVINTSSTAAARPRPGLTVYNASKGAVATLTRSAALEFAPDKVRVNAINPVIGETGLTQDFMGVEDTPENRQKFLAGIPLGRFSTPRDIADAALFLASDEAQFLTGVTLDVDGGRSV